MVVIPWYLIPGRPYPIQVYLYACALYSSNPEMGQRAAAEATREEFGLEKFSHSTLSRSFRTFEESQKRALELSFGEEFKICSEETPCLVGRAEKPETKKDNDANCARRFPTVIETTERRKKMTEFLSDIIKSLQKENIEAIQKENIEAISRQFLEKWHKKYRRLLL